MVNFLEVISFLASKITLKNILFVFVFFNTLLSHSIMPFNYRISQVFVVVVFLFSIIYFCTKLKGRIYLSWGPVFAWMYVIWAAITIIISGHWELAYSNMTAMFMPFYLSMSLLLVFNSKDLKIIVDLMLIFAFLNLLLSFIGIITNDTLVRIASDDEITAAGFFTDVNIAVRYYCLLNGFVLFPLLKSWSTLSFIRKTTYVVYIVMLLVNITLMQSRGGYILLVISLVVPVFLYGSRAVKKTAFLIVPAIIVLFLFMTAVRFKRSGMNVVNWSDLGRVSTLMAGVNMAKQHPVTGVGYQRSSDLFMVYHDKYQVGPAGVATIHNIYIAMLAETGIIGLLLYLTFMLYILKNCYRHFKKDKPLSEYSFGAFMALLISLIHGLLYHSMDYEGSFWLMVVVGLIVTTKNKVIKNLQETVSPS